MSQWTAKCPICQQNAKPIQHGGNVEVECKICGTVTCTGTLAAILPGQLAQEQHLIPALSAVTRQATERREKVVLDTHNWRDMARAHANISVLEKRRRLLERLGQRTQMAGEPVFIIPDADYPLFDGKAPRELQFLLESLKQERLIDLVTHVDARGLGCIVTMEGWARLDPSGQGGIPGRCFVAMACHSDLDEGYERGIRAALHDCNCEPMLIEKAQHNDKICDRVIAEIRLAEFVIADVTFHRQNVYFEAGFAMGLGRDVIWTCREDEFTREKQHFDTRQYPHILWKDPDDLRRQLVEKIRAIPVEGGRP
jgi:hypothetical protein